MPGDEKAPALADTVLGLAAISGSDPSFDRDLFLDGARARFLSVKQAIERRDLNPIGGAVGQGLLATLQAQIDRLAEQHAVHRFENLSIDGMAIARAEHGEEFDNIAVRFDARAAQYAVDEARNQLIFGTRAIQPFIEYWTFTSRAGRRADGPAVAPTCPSCGAPIPPGGAATCRYCRAALPPREVVGWTVTAVQDPIDFR